MAIISFLFRVVVLFLVLAMSSAQADFFKDFDLSKLASSSDEMQLLPDAEAFQIVKSEVRDGQLAIHWLSAPDYYLYRKNFKIVSHTPGVSIGALSLPEGDIEDDPLFGPVEVYFDEVVMRAPITFSAQAQSLQELQLVVHAQGCNQPVGICYPPQEREVLILLNEEVRAPSAISKQLSVVETPPESSFWSYVFTAFGAGLLLVFTPCVLPMLPILSGLIIGSGDQPANRLRSGALSIAYVLGTAITYTAMGALAGAAGIQLQAYFQHPVAILVMVVILLLLALAMFGVFNIAMPVAAQSKLNQWTDKLKSGSLLLALVMGLLSALIVSACVSPLLITALGVAIQKGDPWLGAAMMFSMALGMGVLLIAFGFGASWLVPKAGAWMNRVKELFGFAVLAVAIIVASSIKQIPVLLLWSAWLFGVGFWLWQIASAGGQRGRLIILKVIAVMGFLWAIAAFFGGLVGGQDITQPLAKLTYVTQGSSQTAQQGMAFTNVTTVAEIQRLLQQAKQAKQPVLIDYYADWCLDCKRMDAGTYSQPAVIAAFSDWQRIKIDVTKVNDETQAAKNFYGVFGPPATLFVDANGVEQKPLRRYGYIKQAEMIALANQVASMPTSTASEPTRATQ